MPRTNIWMTEEQHAWAKATFGPDANLSAVVRAGLATLQGLMVGDRKGVIHSEVETLMEIEATLERATSLLDELEGGALKRGRRR